MNKSQGGRGGGGGKLRGTVKGRMHSKGDIVWDCLYIDIVYSTPGYLDP